VAPRELDESATAALLNHDWPGNVRELRNVLERGVYLAPGAQPVKLVSLPGQTDGIEPAMSPGTVTGTDPAFDPSLSYRDNKERWENDFEKRYLTWLMDRAQGNISRAAREADMDRKYLHKLLKKHAIVV
jgi:DNA-binding NtrC family response regulator